MRREALRLSGVRVDDYAFGGLVDATLCLYQGETVMVAGLFNSGIITFLRLLSGSVSEYGGSIHVLGREVRLDGFARIRGSRIAYIGNEPRLFDNLSVEDNLHIAQGDGRLFATLRHGPVAPDLDEWMRRLDIDFAGRPIDELSRFEQLKLEVLRALVGGARIVALAQMFMSCSDAETRELARIVGELNAGGIAVILEVSDKYYAFEEVIGRCIVFRNGMVAATLYKDDNDIFDEDALRHAIVGRAFDRRELARREPEAGERPYLRLVRAGRGIDVYRSTRVGLYDTAETLPRTVDGLIHALNGELELYIEGKRFLPNSVQDLVHSGVAVISKEAVEQPIFLNLSPVENVTVLAQQRFGQRFFYNRRVSGYLFDQVVGRYGLLRHLAALRERGDCHDLPYERQYELMIARWLAINPRILIVYPPLHNTDTKNHERFRDLQALLGQHGKVMIAISSSLDSMEDLCDTIHEL